VRLIQAFDVSAVEPVAPVPERVAPEPEPAESSVQDLFARIKADREDAVARARAVLDELPDVAANGEGLSPNGSVAAADVDESMLQRRDERLAAGGEHV